MRRLVLLATIVLAGASPARAETINKDYDETFQVKPGMQLVLGHGDGDVTISPWDRDEVSVVVKYRAEVNKIGWGSDMKFEVEFTQTASEVRVIGKESGFGGVGIFTSDVREYTYTIMAPDYLVLETYGDDGDLEVSGWKGRLDLKIDDGDMDLERIRSERTTIDIEDGDLRITDLEGELDVRAEDGNVVLSRCKTRDARFRLEDGDIVVRDCEGRFVIEGEDGDVDLLDVKAEVLRVETEDGDITADMLNIKGMDIELSTGDGRVDLNLPENASARFSVRTRDGRIALDMPEAPRVARDKRHVSGTIGDGDGDIRLSTSDGPITLHVRS